MKDIIYYNDLFDVYGNLLTEKERLTFRDYYQEDFSLGEIATNNEVSRSAVSKTLKTVIKKLDDYEAELKIVKNNQLLKEALLSDDIDNIKKTILEVLK